MLAGSLFSGAGLLDAGLAQAGIEHAWFVEREPDRRALLERRWPGVPVHDDVRAVGAHNLQPVDCVAGGFPCKGASTAGKRTGLAHPETALWAEFERIVRELRPRYVAVENVANILALHDGAVWGTVLGDLAALGYDVAWDCVPASAVGAPHGRDRVFAIAADASRVRQGGTGAQAGTDGQRARAVADAAADTAHIGPERGRRARAGRLGLADGGQAPADTAFDGREQRPELNEHAQQRELPARSNAERRGVRVEWGPYSPAIERWEAVHGRAPAPLAQVRRMDDGDAKLRRMRARLDRQRLSALGDGVHVYVGRLVGEALMALEAASLESAA